MSLLNRYGNPDNENVYVKLIDSLTESFLDRLKEEVGNDLSLPETVEAEFIIMQNVMVTFSEMRIRKQIDLRKEERENAADKNKIQT